MTHGRQLLQVYQLAVALRVIPGHRTLTQDFVSNSGAQRTQRTLRPHQHYRMVLGVVARDLMSFRSSWELVNAMGDALQGKWSFCIFLVTSLILRVMNIAHKEAYESAGILHRDISAENILITDDGHGLLIDWDISKRVEKGARQSERSVHSITTSSMAFAELSQ